MSGNSDLNNPNMLKEFNALLVAHLPQLRRQALALTRHKADAEDLLQTAVTSALAARESFTQGTNFKAWVTCILRNRFLSNIRQRRHLVDIADVPESLLGHSGGQEINLEMLELKRQMQRLPAEQRSILIMITVDGMSYDDAAAQLGVAAGTLKCRVFRARAQLEAWMHGHEHTEKPAPRTPRRNLPAPPAHTPAPAAAAPAQGRMHGQVPRPAPAPAAYAVPTPRPPALRNIERDLAVPPAFTLPPPPAAAPAFGL